MFACCCRCHCCCRLRSLSRWLSVAFEVRSVSALLWPATCFFRFSSSALLPDPTFFFNSSIVRFNAWIERSPLLSLP